VGVGVGFGGGLEWGGWRAGAFGLAVARAGRAGVQAVQWATLTLTFAHRPPNPSRPPRPQPNFYINKNGQSGEAYIACCFHQDWNK
jgi:hypothetical protein